MGSALPVNIMPKRNFSWRRLRALIWKEAIQMSHPSSILIAFVLPILLLFLFGYAVSLDSTKLKIGFAIEDHRPETGKPAGDISDSKIL